MSYFKLIGLPAREKTGHKFGSFSHLEYLLEREGFVQIHSHSICVSTEDVFMVWFNYALGILVYADTFSGRETLNQGMMHFVWSPECGEDWWPVLLGNISHDYSDGFITVSIDVRRIFGDPERKDPLELSERLAFLKKNGSFCTKWFRQPVLWLLDHQETTTWRSRYEEFNMRRISTFPLDVQEVIYGFKLRETWISICVFSSRRKATREMYPKR
jgi:hypothetical protein